MPRTKNEIKLAKIKKIQEYLNDNPEKREVKDRFIEQFIICEMLCKDTMLDYWHDKGKKIDISDTEGIKLLPDVIKNSQGPGTDYDFAEDFLLRLFGGKDNRNNPYKTKGCYSVKLLRDNITHKLLITAIDELYERRDEIFGLVDTYQARFQQI